MERLKPLGSYDVEGNHDNWTMIYLPQYLDTLSKINALIDLVNAQQETIEALQGHKHDGPPLEVYLQATGTPNNTKAPTHE